MTERIRMAAAAIIVLFAAIQAPPAAAEPAAPPRAEVPIRQVVLSDGMRRYAVPVGVGGTVIEAGLDSGSTGLRLIGPTVPGVRASGRRTSYSYASGTRLDGVMADAELAIGGVMGEAPVQLVTGTGCVAEKPHCPASFIPFGRFGVQGDGLPGEGFKAILGIDMASAEVPNPLPKLGVRRWIIELPRPGDTEPGRLILDPTDQELAGFVLLHLAAQPGPGGGPHDAIETCLVDRQTRESICGAGILDTGAPGIRVVTARPKRPWPNGTPGAIAFYDHGQARTSLDFTVGLRAEASRLTTEAHDVRIPRLFLGLTPYFGYAVLYDPGAGVIGLKPRG
jgi:hypothetical protein